MFGVDIYTGGVEIAVDPASADVQRGELRARLVRSRLQRAEGIDLPVTVRSSGPIQNRVIDRKHNTAPYWMGSELVFAAER
jgi:hypothetical protein